MKILRLAIYAAIVLCSIQILQAQTVPTTTLRAENIRTYSSTPGGATDVLAFDLYLINTSASVLKYSSGQYFFNVNKALFNSGKVTSGINESPLSEDLLPRNPTAVVSGDTVILMYSSNRPVKYSEGATISAGDSVKIGTFWSRTSTPEGLAQVTPALVIRHRLNSSGPSITKTDSYDSNKRHCALEDACTFEQP